MSIFSPRKGLRARALPRYPSVIEGAAGLAAARANGVLTISFDFSELSLIDLGVLAQSDTLLLVELEDGTFRKVSAQQLVEEIADEIEDSHTHTLSDITDAGALAALNTVDTDQIDDDAVATAKIPDAAITNAKLANMAQATFKGRASGAGTGAPVDLTATQALAALGVTIGTYTPTGTGVSNIDSITPALSRYIRIGDFVQVYGSMTINTTAASVATARISIPVASDFAASTDLSGTISAGSCSGLLFADTTNDAASVSVIPSISSNVICGFSFGYVVQ